MEKINELKKDIEKVFEVDFKDTSRKRVNVNARMVFAKISTELFNMGGTEIGRLCSKDNATVIHYIKVFEGAYRSDFSLREGYKIIKKKWGNL